MATDRTPPAREGLPRGDYVSPGFQIVRPDSAFPSMVVGDPSHHPWPYLRREIPHNWRHDKRFPIVGFASRDEASILHNVALNFAGKRALEIGCWLGWSAAHLALGGVELDIIDPKLEKPPIRTDVEQSLRALGVWDRCRLHAGFSPAAVHQLAAGGRRWSLIFIDGNHEGTAPYEDAVACAQYAEPDAAIVLHDLASPDVAAALDYLRGQGWETLVYQTMQIMGIAWRGNVRPPRHLPDPTIAFPLPRHLESYPISGCESVSAEVIVQECRTIEPFAKDRLDPPRITTAILAADFQSAQALLGRGQESEATEILQRIAAAHPPSFRAHRRLASLYQRAGDVGHSVREYALANAAYFGADAPAEFDELHRTVKPFTLLSRARLFSLYTHARQVCLDDIDGNFVECGTCRGGSAALIAAVIQRYSHRPRKLFAFDTFTGMPAPAEVDRHEGIAANSTAWGEGTLAAPIEQNLAVVARSLGVMDLIEPVAGLFSQTLRPNLDRIGPVALLHADGDWYESTMEILQTFFDRLSPGTPVQIDDYGFWEGCRQAVTDFQSTLGKPLGLRVIDDTGVWFRIEDARDAASEYWRHLWPGKIARALLAVMPGLLPLEKMPLRKKSAAQEKV